MKIPTAIRGRHKIRDAKILDLYVREGWTQEEIGKRFDLSASRVGVIIYRNAEVVKYDQADERNKRISHLRRLLKKHPEKLEQKTTLDILDKLADEIGGKVGNAAVGAVERADTRVIIIRESAPAPVVPSNRIAEEINGDTNPQGSVPGSVSVVRV